MANKNITRMTLIALCVAVNIAGSKIALFMSLPIFLDSIGTIMSGMLLGPWAGMLTALVGGLVNGALGDIYSIYFAPSGMIMGLIAGFVLHGKKNTYINMIWKTVIIVIPASAVSALIEVVVFGGVTSAMVTTALIQIMSKTVMSMFGSAFVVQLVTDYIDKLIAVALVTTVYKRLPSNMRNMIVDADVKVKKK